MQLVFQADSKAKSLHAVGTLSYSKLGHLQLCEKKVYSKYLMGVSYTFQVTLKTHIQAFEASVSFESLRFALKCGEDTHCLGSSKDPTVLAGGS